MKKSLTKRVSELEDREWKVNAQERLEVLERFMRAIRDGKMIIVPSMRYEALERKLGLHYKINEPYGNYRRTKKEKRNM